MTTTLGLTDQKQTYLLWLWLNTALRINFQKNTGSNSIGFYGNMAGQATKDIISRMTLEFPMFTIASQLNISYSANVTSSGQNCNSFYKTILNFPNEQSNNLCNDPSNTFNFVYNTTNYQQYIKTAVALTSVYLYGNKFNTANANYFETFQNLTGWNILEVTN